jgi:hypothetical protein
LKIANPSFVLGSLVIAAAVESTDLARDMLYFQMKITKMVCILKSCHNLKIVGTKADADREKLFKVWRYDIRESNKLV